LKGDCFNDDAISRVLFCMAKKLLFNAVFRDKWIGSLAERWLPK